MPTANRGVPERDKRDVVLEFLAEHPIPLRPKEIYGGLIALQDITFSYGTVKNIMSEFNDDGLVERVEIDDDEGVINPIPSDSSGRRGYYLITDGGKAAADI
jgi:Fe2+ or Zn2+ uptake regulation protein